MDMPSSCALSLSLGQHTFSLDESVLRTIVGKMKMGYGRK